MIYKTLEVCRGVASLAVVLFHLGGAIAAPKYFNLPHFARPFAFGYLGVDFFFVLSGFIIYRAHAKDLSDPSRLPNYLRRRATRIFPTYWVIFALVYAAAFLLDSTRNVLPTDPSTLIRAFLLIPQDPAVVGGTGAPVLIVAWTLQYELVFYAAIGLGIIHRLGLLAVALLFAAAYFLIPSNISTLFPYSFFTQPYIWLFIFGAATSAFCSSIPSRKSFSKILIFTGFAALIGTLTWSAVSGEVTHEQLTLSNGLSFSLIIAGLTKYEEARPEMHVPHILMHLGMSSYALYLLHFPIISVSMKIAARAGFTPQGYIAATSSGLLALTLCLIVASQFHVRIEAPISMTLRRLTSPRPAP